LNTRPRIDLRIARPHVSLNATHVSTVMLTTHCQHHQAGNEPAD
jgi:hypothetical protein